MYGCYVCSIRGLWLFDTVLYLCLSPLKNRPSPTARCGNPHENIVVGRKVQETSGPSKHCFLSAMQLACISRRKQTLREKSQRCVQHNSSFYANQTLVLLTSWVALHPLVVGKMKEKFMICLLEKARINLHCMVF